MKIFSAIISALALLASASGSSSNAPTHAHVGRTTPHNSSYQCVHKCKHFMKQDVGKTVCASAKNAQITLPLQACLRGMNDALTQVCEERCDDSYAAKPLPLRKSADEACKKRKHVAVSKEGKRWCQHGYSKTMKILLEESGETETEESVVGLTDTHRAAQTLVQEVIHVMKDKVGENVEVETVGREIKSAATFQTQAQTLVQEVDQIGRNVEIETEGKEIESVTTFQTQELELYDRVSQRDELMSPTSIREASQGWHFNGLTCVYTPGNCFYHLGISESSHDNALQHQTRMAKDEMNCEYHASSWSSTPFASFDGGRAANWAIQSVGDVLQFIDTGPLPVLALSSNAFNAEVHWVWLKDHHEVHPWQYLRNVEREQEQIRESGQQIAFSSPSAAERIRYVEPSLGFEIKERASPISMTSITSRDVLVDRSYLLSQHDTSESEISCIDSQSKQLYEMNMKEPNAEIQEDSIEFQLAQNHHDTGRSFHLQLHDQYRAVRRKSSRGDPIEGYGCSLQLIEQLLCRMGCICTQSYPVPSCTYRKS